MSGLVARWKRSDGISSSFAGFSCYQRVLSCAYGSVEVPLPPKVPHVMERFDHANDIAALPLRMRCSTTRSEIFSILATLISFSVQLSAGRLVNSTPPGGKVRTGHRGETADVVNIGSAQMITANMVPDKGGLWMDHCHVSEHMAAGMMTRYEVLP